MKSTGSQTSFIVVANKPDSSAGKVRITLADATNTSYQFAASDLISADPLEENSPFFRVEIKGGATLEHVGPDGPSHRISVERFDQLLGELAKRPDFDLYFRLPTAPVTCNPRTDGPCCSAAGRWICPAAPINPHHLPTEFRSYFEPI